MAVFSPPIESGGENFAVNDLPQSAEGRAPRSLAQADAHYFVYVLRSRKSGLRYTGMTGQSLDEKLREHNYATGKWSRKHRPFDLVYSESFSTQSAALKRERFFKTGDGRRVLDLKLAQAHYNGS